MDAMIAVEENGDVFIRGELVANDASLRTALEAWCARATSHVLRNTLNLIPGSPSRRGRGGDIVLALDATERLRISRDGFFVDGRPTTYHKGIYAALAAWAADASTRERAVIGLVRGDGYDGDSPVMHDGSIETAPIPMVREA